VNGKGPFDPRKEAPLLSAYVDGELDPDDVVRVEAHLEEHPETRAEVERLRRLKNLTGDLRLKEPPAEEWEVFWQNVYNRAERSLGWLLLSVGLVVVGGWALLELLQVLLATEDLPLLVKGAIFLAGGGILVLLVSAIRERIYKRGHTRYKDIVR
jgi:anti-sigma factor RsiW